MLADTRLDHITVTAPSLEVGALWVEQTLGVALQPGGEHPRMGTHNRLLRMGEGMFLEVIAVNPAAPPPVRARWFGLDHLSSSAQPSLSNWVARTSHLAERLASASEPLGQAEPLSRGALHWQLSVPVDGSLVLAGAAPALIDWGSLAEQDHPSSRLPDQGVRLLALEIIHPEPARLQRLLESVGFAGPVRLHGGDAPRLQARLLTPHGERLLQGHSP